MEEEQELAENDSSGTFKHGVRSGSGVNVWPDGDAYEVEELAS